MACQAYRNAMMAFLDGELDEGERRRFAEHLDTCEACSQEFDSFRRLKEMTDTVTLAEPEDRLWDDYWNQVYNRVERGLGWILLSLAGIGLLIYGGFRGLERLATSRDLCLTLKGLLLTLIVAVAVLFVSLLRERLFFWRRDRYRDVRR